MGKVKDLLPEDSGEADWSRGHNVDVVDLMFGPYEFNALIEATDRFGMVLFQLDIAKGGFTRYTPPFGHRSMPLDKITIKVMGG